MSINLENLNALQIDILKEIGNIGSGNAATALAAMINKKIDMQVPKVKIVEFKEVSTLLGGEEIPVVGILLKIEGDITGSIMFILDQKASKVLVNLMMGRDAEDPVEFDDMQLSALKELGNIMAGSYLGSLSMLTNLKIISSVPLLSIDMAGAILSVPAIEFGKVGDTVLYIETEFTEGSTKVQGDFFLIPDVDSYEILLKAIGVNA